LPLLPELETELIPQIPQLKMEQVEAVPPAGLLFPHYPELVSVEVNPSDPDLDLREY